MLGSPSVVISGQLASTGADGPAGDGFIGALQLLRRMAAIGVHSAGLNFTFGLLADGHVARFVGSDAGVAATRARADGMRGLADSHTAWFDVRAVKVSPPAAAPPKLAGPAQGALF